MLLSAREVERLSAENFVDVFWKIIIFGTFMKVKVKTCKMCN